MSKNFTSDATPLNLAIIFQYVIALECCLCATKGDIIHVEKKGDVATKDSSIEVKHKLNFQNIDLWKTLKNWIENLELIKDYQFLVLVTTAGINEKSGLINWNEWSVDEKLKQLNLLKEAKKKFPTLKPFIDTVFSFNENYKEKDLLDVLKKFRITYEESRVDKKIEEIGKNHFSIIRPQNRIAFIYHIIADQIIRRGVEAPETWDIEAGDVHEFIFNNTKNYTDNNIPIPPIQTLQADAIITDSNYNNERFVQEINKINYGKKVVEAINDYNRTQEAQTRLLGINSNMNLDFMKNIGEYNSELQIDLGYAKDYHIEDCPSKDIKIRQNHSRKHYIKCMQWPLKKIEGISENQDYFQRGIIHGIVNDEGHTWLIKIEGSDES